MGMDFTIYATAGDGKSLTLKEARRTEATPILRWLGVSDKDIYDNTYMEGVFTLEQLATLKEAIAYDADESRNVDWDFDWSTVFVPGSKPWDEHVRSALKWATINLIVKCSDLGWTIGWCFDQ